MQSLFASFCEMPFAGELSTFYTPKFDKMFPHMEKAPAKAGAFVRDSIQESMPRLVRYFLTMRATLKVMASSNSRKSSPVSFLIFSRR